MGRPMRLQMNSTYIRWTGLWMVSPGSYYLAMTMLSKLVCQQYLGCIWFLVSLTVELLMLDY